MLQSVAFIPSWHLTVVSRNKAVDVPNNNVQHRHIPVTQSSWNFIITLAYGPYNPVDNTVLLQTTLFLTLIYSLSIVAYIS